MSKAAQAENPVCPKGHRLTITDDGSFLWGECGECHELWRVTNVGRIIPNGHPLGAVKRGR